MTLTVTVEDFEKALEARSTNPFTLNFYDPACQAAIRQLGAEDVYSSYQAIFIDGKFYRYAENAGKLLKHYDHEDYETFRKFLPLTLHLQEA